MSDYDRRGFQDDGGKLGQRGGYLKKEKSGAETLFRTKGDLPQLVDEEICSKFSF